MNPTKLSKWSPLIGGVLVLGFVLKTIVDYISYSEANSAPFTLFVLANAVFFILPALILFTVAYLVKRKLKSDA